MEGEISMARPRQYATDAERQAAFRQRSLVVERAGLEELRTLWERVQVAARTAASRGDALARSVAGGTPETLLRRLCEHWEQVGAVAPDRRVAHDEKGGSAPQENDD
jgi:hypothetical protein